MIRTRMLTSHEVVSINSLLKSRARRYVAAYEKTWLFPESTAEAAWEDVRTVLQPPRDALWGFGGEVYIGYRDGSTQYRDAFGRTDTSHRFLTKKAQLAEPAPNDPCGCGSGRKHKKCCRGVPHAQRPPWDVYGLRARNLMFCNAVVDILGLNERRGWENMRRRMRAEQVKKIHGILSMLWPPDTNIADLLPRPDKRVLRAVYMGLVDPRTVAMSVISALAYFDEIIVLNPFPNPIHMKPEFSPTQSPEQHKSQMLKNVSLLLTLQPLIDAGIIHFVPDPMDFNADYRRAMVRMLQQQTVTSHPREDEMHSARALASDDFERAILRLPTVALRRMLRDSQPDLAASDLEGMLRYMERRLANDPLALLQSVSDGKAGGELQVFRSLSVELALFIAHLTGSTIYTDERAYWRQLHECTSAAASVGPPSRWAALSDRLDDIAFTFDGDPRTIMEARRAGKFGRVRHVFRRVWQAALARADGGDVGEIAEHLAARLEMACAKADLEWATCDATKTTGGRCRGRMEVSAPADGFGMKSVHRLLVTFGRESYLGTVPMSLFLAFE